MMVKIAAYPWVVNLRFQVLQACFGVGPRHRVGIRIKYAVQNSTRENLFWTRVSYYDSFELPEHHTKARFEAVSMHTPPEFNTVYSYDRANNKFHRTDEEHIEITQPVMFSTSDSNSAIGLYCPNAINDRERTAFYGFNLWPQTSVARCMYLEEPLRIDEYSYHGFIFVGRMGEVESAMQRLIQKSSPQYASH